MAFKTELSDLLKIEYPILQGGMAWVSEANLATAVSNGGGLGIIGSGNMPTDILKEEIRKIKQMTEKPFGVNLMLLTPHIDELVELVIEEEVPIVTTGAGNPGKYISALKEKDIKVIPVVPTASLAKRVVRTGADAVIAEGYEAGGHVGELTTLVLVPEVVEVVDVPVIAAGGIFDAKGVIAGLALGAKGVQMGTRFICSEECIVDPSIKNMILNAKDRDTVITGRSTGHPVRVLKNKLSKYLEDLDSKGLAEELEKAGTGKLRAAMRDGDTVWGSVMAGQVSGNIKDIKKAADIIKEIADNVSILTRIIGEQTE